MSDIWNEARAMMEEALVLRRVPKAALAREVGLDPRTIEAWLKRSVCSRKKTLDKIRKWAESKICREPAVPKSGDQDVVLSGIRKGAIIVGQEFFRFGACKQRYDVATLVTAIRPFLSTPEDIEAIDASLDCPDAAKAKIAAWAAGHQFWVLEVLLVARVPRLTPRMCAALRYLKEGRDDQDMLAIEQALKDPKNKLETRKITILLSKRPTDLQVGQMAILRQMTRDNPRLKPMMKLLLEAQKAKAQD